MKHRIKHICLLSLIGLVSLLSSCNNGEAEYITEPTEILLFLQEDKLTASTAEITVAPVDDRAYFYIECVPVNHYVPGTMDRDFMMLTMDSVYISYLTWRHFHLVEGQEYIAPFSSHCLKYGVQDVHFNNLEPETEYMVFAFCVNPISNQPMGELFYHYFVTKPFNPDSLTFQFSLEDKTLYIMPSDDNTQYFFTFDQKSVIQNEYHNNPMEFLTAAVNTYKQYGILEYSLFRNAYMLDLNWYLESGKNYLFMCTAYDGALSPHYAVIEIYVDPDGGLHLVKQ